MTTLITPLPTPPTRQDSANFNDRADDFLGALPLFQQEVNNVSLDIQQSASEVEIARQSAVSVVNVTKWVSGNTYSEGTSVWSPINGIAYRKITAVTGGSIDPSLDTSNYKSITDAAGFSYTPKGVGAVATTIEEKQRQTVSVFDYMTASEKADVQSGTASINVTAAFTKAIAAAKHIYVPEGKYLVSTVSFLDKTGYVLEGESPTKTILKGTAASTKVLEVAGSTPGGLNTYNVFKNLTIDMSAMTTTPGAAAGVRLINIWGCSFSNINVVPVSVAQRSMFVGQHVYTTVFDNCDFGGLTGCVELAGYATDIFYSTTTLTFVGCSFAQCLMDYVTSITFLQPIAQGDSNKFQMNRVSGVTIIGGDIEGSATYLAFGADCKNVTSINNAFVGFTGTYSSGNIVGAVLLDQTNSPYYIKNGNATNTAVETNGVVNEIAEVAALTRKSLHNSNVISQQVDLSIQNANGLTLVGQDAAANSYIDARGTGKFAIQQNGTDRLGVTAASQLLINTTTATTVGAAGAASSLPANPVGYLSVQIAGVSRKIPFYNN